MKRLISIALAVILAGSATAGLAIVNRGNDAEGNKVWFDSVALSTAYAMADYGLSSAVNLADPGKTYVENEILFGYLKFGFDENKPDSAKNITVHIASDNASFPTYLNTATPGGSPAKARYANTQGALPVFPAYLTVGGMPLMAQTPAGTNSYVRNPFSIKSDNDNNQFHVEFNAAAFSSDLDGFKYSAGAFPGQTVVSPLRKVSGNYASEFYVGFNGIVKASTAAEGVIRAYVEVGGNKKFNDAPVQTANFGVLGASPTGLANYIDVYKNGKKAYRVFALNGAQAPLGTEQAREYLAQPTVNGADDDFEDYGIGFMNDSTNRFSRFTYREGLKEDGTGPKVAPNAALRLTDFSAGASAAANPGFECVNQMYENAASITLNGTAYKFFKVANQTPGQIGAQITLRNALDGKLKAVMDHFGFSFGYYNATKHGDYEGSGGWQDSKAVSFKYFGTDIQVPDTQVPPPQTGDNSGMMLVVLAAAVLLAAAGLFMVMKRERGKPQV